MRANVPVSVGKEKVNYSFIHLPNKEDEKKKRSGVGGAGWGRVGVGVIKATYRKKHASN